MKQAIAKAGALIEAMEYIRSFKGKIVVVKLGGSILDDIELQKKLLTDVVFMSIVGMQPILVHGGGKAITAAMNETGLEPVWIHGRRYTDERTLNIAEHTLVNNVNTPICDMLKEVGCEPMAMHSGRPTFSVSLKMSLTSIGFVVAPQVTFWFCPRITPGAPGKPTPLTFMSPSTGSPRTTRCHS